MAVVHRPVLAKEVLGFLKPVPGGSYIDATVGGAGHAAAILEAAGAGARLLGMDQDGEILKVARKNLERFGNRALLVQANFSDISDVAAGAGFDEACGILADLGVSSLQLDRAERGFSFGKEGPIDMRMNPEEGESVLQKLRQVHETELVNVLKVYGEEKLAFKIARNILEKMKRGELRTTKDLADAAWQAYPPRLRYGRIHPATRTFQALRIWVNRELDVLKHFLEATPRLLGKGGRLAVISYHSLEDRIVKHTFRAAAGGGNFKVLTKKPMTPSEEEIAQNPRARSAKLRVLERLLRLVPSELAQDERLNENVA